VLALSFLFFVSCALNDSTDLISRYVVHRYVLDTPVEKKIIHVNEKNSGDKHSNSNSTLRREKNLGIASSITRFTHQIAPFRDSTLCVSESCVCDRHHHEKDKEPESPFFSHMYANHPKEADKDSTSPSLLLR
jgi:hypothetical protein